MSHTRWWYGIAALTLVAAARAPKAPAPVSVAAGVDSATVKAAVTDFWQKWVAAIEAGDIAAMADLVTDSVRVDSKGSAALVGKADWRVSAESMLKAAKVTSETITPDVTLVVSEELAWQNGNFVDSEVAGKKKSTDYGRYAAAIQKGSDGKWRISYIMAFADSSVVAK